MKKNNSRGFTLIEFLVVIAGIIIIFALAVPAFTAAIDRAKATKDLSNLRQIAMATQLYMNDNSNVFPGSASAPTATWASQLELNRKYLSVWKILESPFDRRTTSESGDGTTAISYGINPNVYSGGTAISADKITKPTVFIVFAPAQASGTIVSFQGLGSSAGPGGQGVTVLASTSNPGNAATGGTNNKRQKIGAVCADWHVENMAWSGTGPAFTNTTSTGTDPDGFYRWNPQ